MTRRSDFLLDRNCKKITVGAIVSIHGTNFDGYQGLVMDTASKLDAEDGPIAVFFDREVDSWLFTGFPSLERWKGPIPTPDNYSDSSRVVCFEPREMTVEKEWSTVALARRYFGSDWWTVNSPVFPLVPNSHACHLAHCSSGLLATQRTILNFWGQIYEVYCCDQCHKQYNRMCTEVLDFRKPLPGYPEELQLKTA